VFRAIEHRAPFAVAGCGRGEFQPLLAWLRANIHEHGSLHDTQTLLARITGRPLELQPFLDHLHRRYLED
jgi:carboxypeptidase Taq